LTVTHSSEATQVHPASAESEVLALRERIAALEARIQATAQTRRAMLHILKDAHESNLRLGLTRKALIHILDDLRETTAEIQRREQELREKQEQLVQAGKLASLGELTTGVAHELNNPLNNIGLVIGNILDRLDQGSTDIDKIAADLKRTMQQVEKATEIITHLRSFGRVAPSKRELVHLNEVIESSVSLLREQMRLHEIELRLNLSIDDPCVIGNSIQLEQVIMNLLTNARDALATSDTRLISLSSVAVEGEALLIVEDSGPGIPPDAEARIFDPFFTTKNVGDGTGLGLSIVYGIVNEHQGSISLENRPTGARFVIRLPLAKDVEAPDAA
jgi:C4-dicarboxylate-specific signal transduction histidine kinase